MMRLGTIVLTAFLGFALASCSGWQLRGSGQNMGNVAIHIVEKNARAVGSAFREQWSSLGGDTVAVKDSEFTLTIDRERYVRSLLAVSPKTGKAREINLKLDVDFSLRSKEGTLLIVKQAFAVERSFIFDESSVYGTNENSAILKVELARLLAIELVSRVSSSAASYRER
jgi:outer membrane lipopolysaccharide assembly protein LptE/RlpB